MHKCRHTRLPHTLSPNDMRCCCLPCCQPLVELLNSKKNSKSESAQRQTRHMHRSGNCRVLLQTVWFDWRRPRSKLDKKRTVKAISISISVDPDPLARCVVPRLQTATDCAARKGHAVWQCQPVWRRQVCRRTSVPVCLWLSLYLCVSECVCVWVYLCVCVPASAWVFASLFWFVLPAASNRVAYAQALCKILSSLASK